MWSEILSDVKCLIATKLKKRRKENGFKETILIIMRWQKLHYLNIRHRNSFRIEKRVWGKYLAL